MYFLRFLADSAEGAPRDAAARVGVEYRLACSGELYNRNVLAFDWRKCDVTRVLLRTPLELFVASQPFEAHPQELCARLALAEVTEREDAGNLAAIRTVLPDEDIIEDLCSILTLLSRRLISPGLKTREQYLAVQTALGSYGSDLPIPLLSPPRIAAWADRPATVIASRKGHQIIDNRPPPVGVDPDALSEVLLALPGNPGAAEIIYASRLYRAGLELIESRPDISYQLLISTVESLAAVALADYEPDESERLATASAVLQRARTYGLDEEQAKRLALDACKGQRWLKKRFKKFLLDFVAKDTLTVKDRVFLAPENLLPDVDDYSGTLGRIYDMRSGNLHAASPFPRSIAIGTGPQVRSRDLPLNLLRRPDIPPVAWFERAVSIAARGYILGRTSVKSAPFVDYPPQDQTEAPGSS